jgi:hypothetical protein
MRSVVTTGPVNSWVTKPGARLSRAGVATRPTTTSLCVSSERPRPALPERNSYQDSFNGGCGFAEVPARSLLLALTAAIQDDQRTANGDSTSG